MDKQTFEQLRTLDEMPNQMLIDSFNYQFARKNDNYRLIVNENVRPCFFSGDIETKGKIVTGSLNPSYTRQNTEEEQAGMNFAEWYEFCRFRFKRYESDSIIHSTFKNLFKVITPQTIWNTTDKREYLQTNLLNLDWCFYYSKKFPSINFSNLPENLRYNICETWEKNLNWLINISEPRYIFVHGKSIQNWVNRNTTELKCVMQLKNSRKQPCSLFEGKFANTAIPVYYLEHFINVANETITLERINYFINSGERNL